MIKRALRAVGLVRLVKYTAAVEQQQKAELRARKLAQQVEEVRADSRGWKAKAEEAHDQLKKAQATVAESAKRAERAEKLRVQAEHRLALDEKRKGDLVALETQLEESARELALAREELMAIEVKLDILEGAANVLDGRTRTVSAQHRTPEREPTV